MDENINTTEVTETNRKLASIQVISDIRPIENADKIEAATILGWTVVVRKGEFQVGDKCCYFEIDAILKRAPWNEFLFKTPEAITYRLKTVKLRKCISQGLALPLSVIGVEGNVGDNLTERLEIIKYEPTLPAQLRGVVKGNFPYFCKKSEEYRIQSYPDILNEIDGKEVYVTLKVDGTSATYFCRKSTELDNAYDTGVCSRNLLLQEPKEGDKIPVYWEIEKKYDILNKLKSLNRNIQISGECFGPGIQKNRLGIKGIDIAIFTGYDIDNQKYISYNELKEICNTLGLPMVKVVDVFKFDKNVHTLDWWLQKANEAKYDNGSSCEGLVVRPVEECYSDVLDGRMSFKALSNNYLLKNEE